MQTAMKTIILGDEHDSALWSILKSVLEGMHAKVHEKQWGHGGSQEITVIPLDVGNNKVIVESETFIGLSLTGPQKIVEKIADEVMRKKGR